MLLCTGSSSTAGSSVTWQTRPAQQHIQPRIQPPQTSPAACHPPKLLLRSHHPSLPNWQLRQPALFLDLLQILQSAWVFSPPCLSAPPITILSLAVLCQKSLASSLSQGQGALLSFAQRQLQPVPGTLPRGWFPKQAYLSVPNANLLTQLRSPQHFFIHLSFTQVAAPLHLSKALPSPWLTPSTLLHFTLSACSCKQLSSSKSQPTHHRFVDSFYPYCGVTDFFPTSPPCCTATRIPQNVNELPIFLEADFNRKPGAQAGAHLSVGRCWEDALANTSAGNRNQSARLGPWRAISLAAIMHQSLHPHTLIIWFS